MISLSAKFYDCIFVVKSALVILTTGPGGTFRNVLGGAAPIDCFSCPGGMAFYIGYSEPYLVYTPLCFPISDTGSYCGGGVSNVFPRISCPSGNYCPPKSR